MKKLVELGNAQSLMMELREKYYFNRDTESLPIANVLGRELAKNIAAGDNSPPCHIASYDGFAMRSEDFENYPLIIVHRIYAGDEDIPSIKKGEAAAIATGAYLPRGADCVLKLEDARAEDDKLYGVPIEPWTKVVKAGSNYKKGDRVLEEGRQLRPQEIGLLHGLGVSEVKVYKRPKVAVFSTGDEVYRGILRNTNTPMVCALLSEWGCEPVPMDCVPDDLMATKEKLWAGTAYDALITTGGVSMGDRDYVLRAIEELGELLLHKVKTRPGKPLAVGIINGTPVFGLPGKPTGAFMAAELNLRKYFQGSVPRPRINSKITEGIKMATRGFTNIVFVRLLNGHAIPMGFHDSPMKLMKSGDFYNVSTIASSLRSAVVDGYVLVDRDIEKGEMVEVNIL